MTHQLTRPYASASTVLSAPLRASPRGREVVLVSDPSLAKWALISKTASEVVRLCDGRHSTAEIAKALAANSPGVSGQRVADDVRDVVAQLQAAGLLFASSEEYQGSAVQRGPEDFQGLYLELSSRCNLRCRHCYAERTGAPGEIPPQQARDLLTQSAALGGTTAIFSGGEPLLYPGWSGLCEHARDLGLEVLLVTNGTLIDDRLCRLMQDWPALRVQVSLHGATAEVHDALCGSGSHRRTVRGLRRLLQAGLGPRTAVSATVVRDNLHEIAALVDWCATQGLGTVSVKRLTRCGRAAANWDELCVGEGPEDVTRVHFEELAPALGPYQDRIRLDGVPEEKTFSMERMLNPRYPCPIGAILRIDCTGVAFPCQLLGGPDFVVGDVNRQTLAEILAGDALARLRKLGASRAETIEECARCAFKHFCAGGCMAFAFWEYGTVFHQEPLCQHRRQTLLRELFAPRGRP